MNSRIKFRAWIEDSEDHTKMEMCYDLAFEDYEPINDLLARQDNLMQYTGLKDKNGKEIYEGDIIAFDEDVRILARPTAVIELRGPAFGMMARVDPATFDKDVWHTFHPNTTLSRSEVIGNIWEHPELLEKQDD